MKVRVNLSVEEELVRRARENRINLSALLEEVLQRGFRRRREEYGKLERIYEEYKQYRESVERYEDKYVFVWLERRAIDLNIDPKSLKIILESKYEEEWKEGMDRAALSIKTGSEEEILNFIYNQYRRLMRMGILTSEGKRRWIEHRRTIYSLKKPLHTLLREFDEKLEKERETVTAELMRSVANVEV